MAWLTPASMNRCKKNKTGDYHYCMENSNNDYSRNNRHPNTRELTLQNGISYPSDEELVMLILGRGTRANPIEQLADQAVETINTSTQENLIENLTQIEGVGQSKALALAAAIELGRRRKGFLNSAIQQPKDVVPYVRHYALKSVEHFITITTNGAREIISTRVISIGTINRAIIHPREVYSEAVKEHASGIICCHNHPCNQCYPSEADIESTRQLQKAASILGISFMDHIIITRDQYFSFLEHNMLEPETASEGLIT